MTDHREAAKLATATMVELIARGQALQAAVIRGASEAEIEKMRQDGLALAEAYLDRTLEAGRAARAILDGHPEAGALGEEGARLLD